MMNVAIILAITAGMMFGILSLAYKYANLKKCRSAQFTFALSLSAAGVTFFKSLTETSKWSDPLLWGLGAVMGIVIVAGIFVLMTANRLGPVSSSWTVVNVSFLLAIFLSAIVLRERLLCVDPINLAIFGLTLYLFVRGMRAESGTSKPVSHTFLHLLTLLGVFLTNGLVAFASKLKYTFWSQANTSALPTVFYLVSALITLVMIQRQSGRLDIAKDEWKAGAMGGLLMSIGTILFLTAMSLPAAAVFPITQGTSLTAGVALTTLIAKERLNRWMVLGVLVGLLLLFAVIYRETTAALLCG